MSRSSTEVAMPRGLPRGLARACGLGIAVGVVAFVAGLAVDPRTTWTAFHVNYLYYASLAQGGVLLAAILVLVGANWPGPVRRLAEALGAWVPVTVVLYLIGFLGREYLYPWIEHPVETKAAWLNVPRLFLTDLGILLVMAWLSLGFLYHSLRPALRSAATQATGRRRRWLERWTADWRGDEAERERSLRGQQRYAAGICLVYAFGYSVIGFDQVMSLEPTWYSNLFGAYFAWGGFLCAVAVTALLAVLHRRAPGLEGEITKSRMHDLGKMIFAFSIFWMYLFWSQYLVIWYGNLPEETSFIQARLGSQFLMDKSGFGAMYLVETWRWSLLWKRLHEPYCVVTLTAWALCWIVPFWVLLGQRPKRTPAILGGVAFLVALGFWIERNVLVWPSIVPGHTWSWVGPIQVGLAIGFLAAFALAFLVFTRVFPSLPVPKRS